MVCCPCPKYSDLIDEKKKMDSRTRLKKRFDNFNNKRNLLIESNTGQSCELNQDLNTAIHRQPLSLESVPQFIPFKLGVFFYY